jgi:D-amino peptidase
MSNHYFLDNISALLILMVRELRPNIEILDEEENAMRVYITADMEGVTGLVRSSEVLEGEFDYEDGRSLMTRDLNATIAGAFDGGATEVWVNDAHAHMTNIKPQDLDPRAYLIRGFYMKRAGMTEGLDGGFDAYLQVGMHPMVGKSPGVMNETIWGREIHGLRLNGRDIGEIGMNAAYAGAYNVPLCLVTGDDFACQEAKDLDGVSLETVTVKWAINRWAARCLSPKVAEGLIREAAQVAVQNYKNVKPYTVKGPVTFDIIWTSTAEAAIASMIPGVQVDDQDFRINRILGENYLEAYNLCLAALLLGGSATDVVYG